MLGLGLGFGKLSSYKYTVKKLIDDYIKRVTAAGGYLEGNECATAKVRELNSQRLLDDASWLLIPEGIKEDVVYAQKPTSGLGDLVFTRASDATRTNSAGVIERTPWNLLERSEAFDSVFWAKTEMSVVANTITAPNGTLTADKIVASTNSSIHFIAQDSNLVLGVTYTQSVYAKAGGYVLQITGSTGFPITYVNFDLSNGTIGGTNGGVATITNVGDGWYRLTYTLVCNLTGAGRFVFALVPSTSSGRVATFAGNGTDGVFIWGAQLVEGTDAKPYFATTNRQDVPRLDYRNADGSVSTCPRLLLEPQRTNSIRNSTMVGAVAGSPGTLPTNWSVAGVAGLTREIVSVGTENGIQYIDVKLSGTALATDVEIRLESQTQIVAANAQVWTQSIYLKTISEPSPPASYRLFMIERTAGGSSVASGLSSNLSVDSSLNRFSFTRTLSGGVTVERVQPSIFMSLTIGATYDFTIRIAAPQMELGAYATTFIPTTTAAVTRLADYARNTGASSLIGQTEGTMFVDAYFSVTAAGRFLSINDGTTFNRILLVRN